jgi:catechol 2,3-dioxygenase-like lactoylglutathione lyase family enzyme
MPVVSITRRKLAGVFAGIAATRLLRGDPPTLTVSGVDHLKLRVAVSGASAMFYYGLFGGEILFVRNTTFPGEPLVDEFFFRIGSPAVPYLILSQVTARELPGLDHLSILTGDFAALRPTLERNAITLIKPNQGFWFRDADGTLIELMAKPTWAGTAPRDPLALPADLRSRRPAFEPVALKKINLRALNVDRSAEFYNPLFGGENHPPPAAGRRAFTYGASVLEFVPLGGAQTPGLDRLVIAVRNLKPQQARRILQERGIHPHGSRHEVLFRDPDGNELELVAS